jgi:hypothetical protein
MEYYNGVAVEVGDIVTWHDRELGARKGFKVEEIKSDSEGSERLLISDGFSEAEVPLSELEPKTYTFTIYTPVKGFYAIKHVVKSESKKEAEKKIFASFVKKDYDNSMTLMDARFDGESFEPYEGKDMVAELVDANNKVLAQFGDTCVWCKGKV